MMTHSQRVAMADEAMNNGLFMSYDHEHACFHTMLSMFGRDYASFWTTILLDPYFVQQGMVASQSVANGHAHTSHLVAVSAQCRLNCTDPLECLFQSILLFLLCLVFYML